MRRLSRLMHSLGRFRHGRGFGVHSPFAFAFILRTLRERTPYYAYPLLNERRRMVKHSHGKGHRPISAAHVRMIFRIVNRFSPSAVVEIGSLHGEELAAILEVAQKCTLSVYAPAHNFAEEARTPYTDRICVKKDLPEKINASLVVVGNVDESLQLQCGCLMRTTMQTLEGRMMVLVFPDLQHAHTRRLWAEVRREMPYGMTFDNEKSFAVAVVNPKLPRQDFRVSI